MIITAELSHYPLVNDYEGEVISFIHQLKEGKNVLVFTNAMATYVKGDSKEVFEVIRSAVENSSANANATVIKIINRDLPIEKGKLEF